jgi:hypothetical protein
MLVISEQAENLGVKMVRFEELKTGDRIARRIVRVEGNEVIRSHAEPYVVRAATVNAIGGTRSVWLGQNEDSYGMWLHDLQFSTIQDELNRWDKL